MKEKSILVCLYALVGMVVCGQCPDRDLLWKRLIFLRDSSHISPEAQLKELLDYEGQVQNCSYKNDSVHAFLLQRIGVMYYATSDYLNALPYIKHAIKINTPGPGKTSVSIRGLIRAYYNLSSVYSKLNRAAEKISAIDSCVTIALRTGFVDVYSLYSLKEKIEYLFDVGDYQRAFSAAELGESVIKQYLRGRDSIDYILNFLNWKVNALFDFKDYDLAEKIVREKIEDCKSIGAKDHLGTLYEQLAMVLTRKKDYSKAERCFQLALQFYKKDKYSLGCGQTLTNLGFCLYFEEYKNYQKAIDTYKGALEYIRNDSVENSVQAIESLNIYASIANAFVQMGSYDSAFIYFRRAFDQIKTGINEEAVLHTPLDQFVQFKKMEFIVGLLIGKGDAYFTRFKETKNAMFLNEAIRIYKISDLLINKIKSEQSESLSKLFWRKQMHLLYEHAIDACYLGNNLSDAFLFFEKSRAVLLNDQLIEQRWMDEGDILKTTQVKKEILRLERQLDTTSPSSVKYGALQSELYRHKIELDRLGNIVKSKNPLYYQGFLDSTSISIGDVRNNLLKDHQALVEFFSGDSNVYCYVVTPDKTRLTRIDKKNFENSIILFNSFVSNRELLNRSFDKFRDLSYQLYQLIFKDNPLPVGRIIISPAENYFPFEALIVSNSANIDYFFYDHAVSYTYSARYLMNQFASNPVASSRDFMGMAPVRFKSEMYLAELRGSDNSLRQLKSYFKYSDDFISARASKNNFLQEFSKYKIIQLYTHALSNSTMGEPVIYFADSALYLSDLFNEQRPATRLIMLSACETAKGKFYQGEGVFSFSRGFAALGIPSSITNLWSVENESTYRLTELFYKYLSKGLSPDMALQKAKRDFISSASKEKQMPYFWASAILIGKTDKIEFRKTFPWTLVLLSMGVLILCYWGWNKFTGRKKTNNARTNTVSKEIII